MILLSMYHNYKFKPVILENEKLRQSNFELKALVSNCNCKECKITLKTVRGLYSINRMDTLLFDIQY